MDASEPWRIGRCSIGYSFSDLVSHQCQLRVDLARALIKKEREQKIASLTVGKRGKGNGILEDTRWVSRQRWLGLS